MSFLCEVWDKLGEIGHHPNESMEIFSILGGRHVLDVPNFVNVRCDAIVGVCVSKERYASLFDEALCRVEHQPFFLCSLHQVSKVPVVVLTVLTIHIDIIADPCHSFQTLQDLVHPGLKYILRDVQPKGKSSPAKSAKRCAKRR